MNNNFTGMIDIHSHFLPGLDDGPEIVDQCVATAKKYCEIGIDCLIATPHYIEGTKWSCSGREIEAVIRHIRLRLQNANIRMYILPGMEIALTDTICRNFNPAELLSLGETGSFLVELPMTASASDPAAMGVQKLLARRDCSFILAHPERCALFQDNPDALSRLVAGGMLTQINISSLLGLSGKKTRQRACEFVHQGLVHFLATDSHARGNRLPPTVKQLEKVKKLLGEQGVQTALRENPLRLLRGERILPIRTELSSSHKFSVYFGDSFRSCLRKIVQWN